MLDAMTEATEQTKAGRPTDYTVELGDDICVKLAEGKSLRSICGRGDMPVVSTVLLWVVKGDRGDQTYSGFSEQYRRAREAQAEALLDEVIEIADDGSNDTYTDSEGNERVNFDHINRSRLRVDTRFKAVAKMHPRRYGEKVQTEVTGANGQPLVQPALRVEFVSAPKRDPDTDPAP